MMPARDPPLDLPLQRALAEHYGLDPASLTTAEVCRIAVAALDELVPALAHGRWVQIMIDIEAGVCREVRARETRVTRLPPHPSRFPVGY